MGTIYHVAILGSTIKIARLHIGSWISICESRQKKVLYRIRDALACVLGKHAGRPWIVRAGPPMWIIMPEHYVSPPYGV